MKSKCLNILNVDDMSGIRSLLSTIVKDAGHNSYTASTGLEALKVLETVEIDLVFLDIKLPDINGITVMERSKGLNYSPTIVAMTGFAEQQIIDKILKGGADRCITKPFNIDDIYTIISEMAAEIPAAAAAGWSTRGQHHKGKA